MTSSNDGDHDPLMADLQRLANETALVENLGECEALLRQLPNSLADSSKPVYQKTRMLQAVLVEVLDRAHASTKADSNDAHAARVLAAGAVMGLVTEEPNGYAQKPSEMTRKAISNLKEPRQLLAGAWLIPPINTRRGFHAQERDCLEAFRHDLLSFVEDEQAVRALAMRLGVTPTPPAAPSPEPPLETTPEGRTSRFRLTRGRVTSAIVVLALIGAGFGFWLKWPYSPATGQGSENSAPPASRHIGLPPGHKTYTEQEGELRSKTFNDPYNPSTSGVKVEPYQKVQVSCKVYSVPVGWNSVYPDGYWYRLAGPWHNDYYAIAKNFMNGDRIGEPTQHNTDFKIPTCPH